MSSLDIILPRFFLKNVSIMTSIDIPQNPPFVNEFFCRKKQESPVAT